MRHWHRIISLVAGVFLLVVSVTGVLLHVREFLEEEERETVKPAPNLASGIPTDWTNALNKGLAAVYAQNPTVRVERIRIDLGAEGEKPRLLVQTRLLVESGGERRINYVISEQGTIVKSFTPEKNLLFRLHTGEILGDVGEGFNLLMGLGLVGLLLTGGVLLWEMVKAAPSLSAGVRKIVGLKAKVSNE